MTKPTVRMLIAEVLSESFYNILEARRRRRRR